MSAGEGAAEAQVVGRQAGFHAVLRRLPHIQRQPGATGMEFGDKRADEAGGVQLPGRAGEVALLGGGEQIAEMTQFQGHGLGYR